jgi:hypothetical protein
MEDDINPEVDIEDLFDDQDEDNEADMIALQELLLQIGGIENLKDHIAQN